MFGLYLSIATTATSSTCTAIKDGYRSGQCCGAETTPSYCWSPNMKFPDLMGNAAPYVYEGLNVRDATHLYTFLDPTVTPDIMLGHGFFSSYTNDPTAYPLTAITHDVNNPYVKEIIETTLSGTVAPAALKSVLGSGEALVVVPGSVYAYKIPKVNLTVGAYAGYGYASLRNTWDGASYVMYECASASTVLPSAAESLPLNTVPTPTLPPAASVLTDSLEVLYAPPASGLTVGQSYTMDQLRQGKEKVMLKFLFKLRS